MLLLSPARCAANIIKAPFATLRALKSLFVGPAVLVSLALIYLMTSPGHWWVQWAALESAPPGWSACCTFPALRFWSAGWRR